MKININLITHKVVCERLSDDSGCHEIIQLGLRILDVNQEWSNQFKEVDLTTKNVNNPRVA